MEHKRDETETDARSTGFVRPSVQRAFTVFSFNFPLLHMAGNPVSIYLDICSLGQSKANMA
ncbi:hypothetical protein A2U01_0043373 [Trifolium medium]|uniref:Uncharacterized protein n=1 Tax=Trifolium medium TaxID=97028 RepID=A0A392QEC0_9FABA|nr:hypothetical protein [Trifolium medium]